MTDVFLYLIGSFLFCVLSKKNLLFKQTYFLRYIYRRVDVDKNFCALSVDLFFVIFLFRFSFHKYFFVLNSRFYLVFHHCLSDLSPTKFKCSKENGRERRDIKSGIMSDYEKCERIETDMKMLKHRFEILGSYLSLFIGNIIKHFSDARVVEGVR